MNCLALSTSGGSHRDRQELLAEGIVANCFKRLRRTVDLMELRIGPFDSSIQKEVTLTHNTILLFSLSWNPGRVSSERHIVMLSGVYV